MSELDDDINPESPENEQQEEPTDFFVDILSGKKESSSAKKLLVQKVLRQLIESYGFDRRDLEINFNPQIQTNKRKRIDVAIFRAAATHTNDNLQRVIVCKPQKKREKLRSISEAEPDLRELKDLMGTIPSVTLGMWTNGQEEFFFQLEHTRFEPRPKPLGTWPVPGEHTSDVDRAGGVIQISAEATGLEEALSRCLLFLSSNQNVGLGERAGFQQVALLLFAKIYDETLPLTDRQFWISGDEPFTPQGQEAIQRRVQSCIDGAIRWRQGVLTQGWVPTLTPNQTARVVTELARYSLSETQPRYRTGAFRAIARGVMDGREGRYPTPLNVAEMAVQMLAPKPDERLMDCASGTGTFLAMAAAYIFNQHLVMQHTNPEEASPSQIIEAQSRTAEWASTNAFGCDIDPFLVVASRMNLLFTTGDAGRIFRLDARTFPDGDLDGVEAGRSAMPLDSMDVLLLNPWFSTQYTVGDDSILQRYELGNAWEPDGVGCFRNTGNLNTGGVPPEVLFLERAIQWVKPGTGRVGILLPDGLLGNPAQEYVRWWILRHCEVLASVDLPIEPFKVTVKEYGLTPALPSFLVLRRRSREELLRVEHPEYKVFMAVVDRAGVNSRGSLLFRKAPDGEEIIFDEQVVERVREAGEIHIKKTTRRMRRIDDELPIVASKFADFLRTGEVSQ
jgi:type I restriction enzyme M protein